MAPHDELSDAQRAAVDDFYRREAPRLAAALKSLPWTGGGDLRDSLAAVVEAQRESDGALDKATFDSVLKWGFGKGSTLSESQIGQATRDAFRLLASRDEIAAVKRLQQLPGIGVSRATKILALADQQNLGIYDSHAAHSLRSITDGALPLIRVPPGLSKKLQGTPPASQKQLAEDYAKYNAVLRRVLENAQRDLEIGKPFRGGLRMSSARCSVPAEPTRPRYPLARLAPHAGFVGLEASPEA